METIGFVGVGKIGLPIAENLIKSGYRVLGYRRSSLADFEKIGGVAARSPAEIGAQTDIVARQLGLLVRNDFGFRSLALSEVKKYRRSNLVALAAKMVRDLDPTRYTHWGKPGIRAQLLDIRTRQLVSDFHLEGDDRSMHVLNAVSPAFTSSIPFAAYVVDRI